MKQNSSLLLLLAFLLLNSSLGAIVNLTDFINQQKNLTTRTMNSSTAIPSPIFSMGGVSKCAAGQVFTKQKGCIQVCDKQLLLDCEDVFGDFVDEQVCAWGSASGNWQYFGSKCSACQDRTTSGYISGRCDGLIPEINVGKPLTDPYWSTVLPGLPICKPYEIYTKQRGCIQACSHPDFKKCADNFIALYNPRFCAYSKKGEWKNFTFACQACSKDYLQSDYIGVADGACKDTSSVPVVIGRCKSDSQCQTFQKCLLGTCLDKCSGVSCKNGTKCQNGKCIPPITDGQCLSDRECSTSQFCFGGLCVTREQKCGNTVCKITEKCSYGKCIATQVQFPMPKCQSDAECGLGQKCNSAKQCVDKCQRITCANGRTCVQGVCENQKCGIVTCPAGTFCQGSKCVPDILVCPAQSKYETKVCTDPRPTNKTCLQIFYFRAPDPVYCGVRADGTRINFAQQCTTCKDKSIVYYFTVPCHKVPFVCNPADTCDGTACSQHCKTDDSCPYNWQMCVQGKCMDRCAVMRCAKGPCKFGQCAFQEPGGKCTLGLNSGCKDGQTCVGFECADLCLRQACPAGQNCDKGNCIPANAARRI